jgi:hypothetical protein
MAGDGLALGRTRAGLIQGARQEQKARLILAQGVLRKNDADLGGRALLHVV